MSTITTMTKVDERNDAEAHELNEKRLFDMAHAICQGSCERLLLIRKKIGDELQRCIREDDPPKSVAALVNSVYSNIEDKDRYELRITKDDVRREVADFGAERMIRDLQEMKRSADGE
jgi:hypothetical protein